MINLKTAKALGLTVPPTLVARDALNYFEIVGRTMRNRYRIHYGISVNVHELDNDGNPRTGWCFAPIGNLPAGDVMLAQKIALETDELGALTKANRFAPDLYSMRDMRQPF